MPQIAAGLTSQLMDIFIQDSSKTDGSGLTGLTSGSSGLICYYKRQGAATWTQLSLQAMTQGTWASGGFVEGDSTHAKGVYELGLADAMIASSAGVYWVDVILQGATNMAPVVIHIELIGISNTHPVVGTGTNNFKSDSSAQVTAASVQGNVTGSVASVTGAVGSVTGAVGSVTAAVTTTYGIKKNTAFNNFEFEMVLSSDNVSPATGKTVTATRSIDGGAYAACANAVTEVSGGTYKINLANTDLNGAAITFAFAASGCNTTKVEIVTQT